jgi:hypothetical protein
MKSTYRVMFDRSGAAIDRIEPGSIFGWNRIEWFQIIPDGAGHSSGGTAMRGGSLSIGLPLGHAFQYLMQVQVGRAPLAGVIIETTNNLGKRRQVNFRDVVVTTSEVTNGRSTVQFSYDWIKM